MDSFEKIGLSVQKKAYSTKNPLYYGYKGLCCEVWPHTRSIYVMLDADLAKRLDINLEDITETLLFEEKILAETDGGNAGMQPEEG
jgi:hypothetical protein